MDYYIYRFLNTLNHVIYVGRTNNLKNRMSQHFGSQGHLSKAVYDEVKRIDYLVLNTKNDMKIKELYYISKYKPCYNTADMHDISFALNEIEDVWVTLDVQREKETMKVSSKLKREKDDLLEENDRLQKEKDTLADTVYQLEQKLCNMQNTPSKEYVTVQVDGTSEDMSYMRAVQALEENSEAVFTNTVDGQLRFLLFSDYGEIWCQIYPHNCSEESVLNKMGLLIMKSKDKDRELKKPNDLKGYPQLQLAILIEACNNWVQSGESTVESDLSHLWGEGLVQENALQLIS